MSSMKEYATKIEQAVEVADLDCHSAMVSLMALSDLAWNNSDQPVWSPDEQWLAITETQLKRAQTALQELRDARIVQQLEGSLV
jgi:hypothetical protein